MLVSDDLAMQALAGTPAERALGALAAGCDVALYCSGEIAADRRTAGALPAAGRGGDWRGWRRRGRWRRRGARPLDGAALAQERNGLLT